MLACAHYSHRALEKLRDKTCTATRAALGGASDSTPKSAQCHTFQSDHLITRAFAVPVRAILGTRVCWLCAASRSADPPSIPYTPPGELFSACFARVLGTLLLHCTYILSVLHFLPTRCLLAGSREHVTQARSVVVTD